MATAPASPGIAPEAHPAPHSEREPLPPGVLPNITDTDPPPLNPATEVGDGYVRIDKEKLKAHHEPAHKGEAHGSGHPQPPRCFNPLPEGRRAF